MARFNTDPAVIRVAITESKTLGVHAAAERAGVSASRVWAWRKRHADTGGQWPTDADVTEWRSKAHARERDRAYRVHRHLVGLTCIDATGTQRRLQALVALGWTWIQLGEQLGVSKSVVWQLGVEPRPRGVRRDTAAAVTALYDQLCMTRPEGWVADQARNRAARRGWAPPLAWDEGAIDDPTARPEDTTPTDDGFDQVVVERILAGDYQIPSTREERTEVVRRWAASGRPINELARVTGWKPERYYRHKDQEAA